MESTCERGWVRSAVGCCAAAGPVMALAPVAGATQHRMSVRAKIFPSKRLGVPVEGPRRDRYHSHAPAATPAASRPKSSRIPRLNAALPPTSTHASGTISSHQGGDGLTHSYKPSVAIVVGQGAPKGWLEG